MTTNVQRERVGLDGAVATDVGALLESDNIYFELGGKVRRLAGGQLSWTPCCEKIPVGCVIHRVNSTNDQREAQEWVDEFEQCVHECGGAIVRIYIQCESPVLETVLERCGYKRRKEFALMSRKAEKAGEPTVVLRQIETAREMRDKSAFDAESELGPDGHLVDADAWHAAMKAKWSSGQLTFYFIEQHGGVCGTIGAMQLGRVVRLKNLTIRPAYRRQGFGMQAVLALQNIAMKRGCALGTFGIEGQGGFKLYRDAGLSIVGQQHEWTKAL